MADRKWADLIPVVPFGGLHGSGNDKTQFERIAELERDLAAAQEALHFVERWANHHGVKPTCTAKAALSTIQHYPPILAITRSYADGKVPETRNPWAELKEAQEARQRDNEGWQRTYDHDCAKLIERAKRAEERAAACEKDAELMREVNRAVEHIPEGLELTITVERGAAWVSLFDVDAGHIPLEEYHGDGGLAGELRAAIDAAIAARAK